MHINNISVSGNLTSNAKVEQVGDKSLIKFTVANDTGRYDSDGKWQPRVSYFNCERWTKTADVSNLKKGVKVVVQGTMQNIPWEKGDKRGYNTSINVATIDMLVPAKEKVTEA